MHLSLAPSSPGSPMRWLLTALGLMISLATGTDPLGAQGQVRAGARAGIAMPSGVLQDQANPGWQAGASLDVHCKSSRRQRASSNVRRATSLRRPRYFWRAFSCSFLMFAI